MRKLAALAPLCNMTSSSSAQYSTPIDGLYLCGAGTHAGGGVTGAPAYNAAHQILKTETQIQ